ncbi:hypothetical protein [Cytophaga aurantiaca]|uniref:hypothetical protein n=1 Tax=Cytophaga aurantiaca TaxID=29530 RepID=UPI0012FA16B6|nr:hypothetical protein [Cytophaga aurantiaca]
MIIASCQKDNGVDRIETVTFSSCAIKYSVYKNGGLFLYEGHSIPNEMEYESAKRKLAICLCEEYLSHPSDSVKSMILDIYHSEEQYFHIDTSLSIEFDSIVSNRNIIFNPEIIID